MSNHPPAHPHLPVPPPPSMCFLLRMGAGRFSLGVAIHFFEKSNDLRRGAEEYSAVSCSTTVHARLLLAAAAAAVLFYSDLSCRGPHSLDPPARSPPPLTLENRPPNQSRGHALCYIIFLIPQDTPSQSVQLLICPYVVGHDDGLCPAVVQHGAMGPVWTQQLPCCCTSDPASIQGTSRQLDRIQCSHASYP